MSKIETLVAALQEFYGALPAPPRDPFTLFVWETLSVHATPRKRDAALAALRRFRALTPDAMSRTAQKKLEEAVMLAGPYAEQRLHALRTGVSLFRRTPSLPAIITGPIAAARRALKGLPQMGDGGAYRMLLFAADHPMLPVDAAVHRVATRLGFGEVLKPFSKSARSIREAVARDITPTAEAYGRAYLYLSHHGVVTCTEADPHCLVCPLRKDCPEGQKRLQRAD